MSLIPFLEPGQPFPPSAQALETPNGLLAASASLELPRLREAYQRGIFPWFEDPQPVLWWSPDPRTILPVGELHCSRSLRRTLRRRDFRLSVDRSFVAVMRACGGPRRDSTGTWITPRMLEAYQALHEEGLAHSIEVWNEEGALVGGLYGVALGGTFFGESMFSAATDASKVALVALDHLLRQAGATLIDCQMESDHLARMGARTIPREDFEAWLARNLTIDIPSTAWHVPTCCGELL